MVKLADRAPEEPAPPASPDRWWRYSLRSLIVVIFLTCGVFAYLGITYQRTRGQRALVAPLERYGAEIGWRGGDVVRVTFSGDRFEDPALQPLAKLPRLERLVLIDKASDQSLELIRPLKELRQLLLINAQQISDDGLVHLRGLKHLEVLWVEGAPISDAGLQHVAGLSKLRRLNLNNTRITDGGLNYLRGLALLERLDLSGTRVTPDGVDKLKQSLPNTQVLYTTRPTDAAP